MKRKRTSVFCVLALLAVLLPVPARADMGPKPSMTIHVENPPSGIYYLDLLVPGEAPDELFDNQDWNDLSEAQMDAEIITNLRTAARDAGGEGTWHLAMLDGTLLPMYGEIQSTDDTFRYDYHGVPDESSRQRTAPGSRSCSSAAGCGRNLPTTTPRIRS